jgi:hypothetical protein
MAKSYKLATRNLCKNQIISPAMTGEISMPIGGNRRRIGSNTGSVTRIRNCTIGLYGSALTKLTTHRIKINHHMMVKRILITDADASTKLAKTNIKYSPKKL